MPSRRTGLMGLAVASAPADPVAALGSDGVVLLLAVASGVIVLLGLVVAFLIANAHSRRARRELTRSEQRFRDIVESSLDIITIIDPRGTILLESPSVERVLGYNPEERRGQDAFEVIHPDDVPRVREKLVSVLRAPDAAEQVEFRARAKDGGWRVMEALGRNVMHSESLEGILVTSRDITRQREAERLERRIGRILEDSTNEIFLVDPTTMRLIEANREARKNLGYSREELLRMTPFDFVAEPPPDKLREFLAPLFRGGTERIVRIAKQRRKDGSIYDVEVRVSMTRSEDPPLMIAMVADITQRLATEAQLRQAQKMEAVGRLAGGVAHDFNNLLQVILGHGELLLDRPDVTPPTSAGLRQVVEAAEKAADLTQQLLAFGRRQVLRPRVLDLNTVVHGIENMVRRIIGERITLEVRLDPALGAVLVDRGRIEQVVLNLVVNAVDAMPDGGELVIETGNVVLDAPPSPDDSTFRAGAYVMLAVTDTGVGMTPEVVKLVFEPFFTTKELGKGTGLGLATALGIVEQSGGRIRVESEPDRGARFEVFLPRAEGAREPEAPIRPARAPLGTETILVVEDDPAVRQTVRRMLEEGGYRVHAASGADEALELAERLGGAVDLLVSDVVMPAMDGRDLAGRLRARYPSIRVLLMSGHTDSSIVAPGPMSELDSESEPEQRTTSFIQKPFTPEALARKVREVLDRS